jgi:hypothetical protein
MSKKISTNDRNGAPPCYSAGTREAAQVEAALAVNDELARHFDTVCEDEPVRGDTRRV